jgi:hypothetical protein
MLCTIISTPVKVMLTSTLDGCAGGVRANMEASGTDVAEQGVLGVDHSARRR